MSLSFRRAPESAEVCKPKKNYCCKNAHTQQMSFFNYLKNLFLEWGMKPLRFEKTKLKFILLDGLLNHINPDVLLLSVMVKEQVGLK